ncbi:hypothetical protein B0O99DRAFT_599863 [Bisporella sp. PMI_857]|nr:hypothetical protein B0O99DRAFT_599863 [Bisporella sp. PMI_857]
MAFRHSTQQPTASQRIYSGPINTGPQQTSQHSQPLADSQEWILFSPSAASTTDRAYTTSTVRTRTAGRSRISDFGSLDTAARSYDQASEHTEEAIDEEEDGELDSLDSHLHEFRTDPSVYREETVEQGGTVLPTHDGLGSFRIDPMNAGEDMQQHLYAFERYNPRRVKRRRESLELGMLELEGERAADIERTRRIEEWRAEQSRILVEEIQRETRRRRQSMSSERRTSIIERKQEDVATLSDVDPQEVSENVNDNESFWNKITRRVIRDLMGIDDDLLSIIFGEKLPEDDDLSTTPPARSQVDAANSIIAMNRYDESSWEHRLLERIARELGILVSQISDHPGAFSAYLETQQTPLPYAGLPVIPESARDVNTVPLEQSNLTTVQFQPTLQSAPLPIPALTASFISQPDDLTPRPSPPSHSLSKEDWERDLDIKMVYHYLRSRFTRSTSAPSVFTHSTSHLATASTVDTAARAARVRQHHPLVTSRPSRPRTFRVSVPGKETAHIRRGSSGCGSERMSGVGKRTSQSSTGSRHYWDFGHGTGSVGSGSLITSTGAMGSWGV